VEYQIREFITQNYLIHLLGHKRVGMWPITDDANSPRETWWICSSRKLQILQLL